MITGVTAGKFYPFHLGHHYMLSEASKAVDQLYILVVQGEHEWPLGTIRKEWVREEFPNAKVILCENLPGQEQDSAAWAQYAKDLVNAVDPDFKGSFDRVFGSEDYTNTWAKELDAEAFVVDHHRCTIPISGTRLREDPHGLWRYLTDPAKEFYCKRLCVVGGESTGKSTMVRKLAQELGCLYTPEVGRFYVEEFGDSIGDGAIWRSIVSTQVEVEDHLARQSGGKIVCDTDLLTTSIWFERWVGEYRANPQESHMYSRILDKWARSEDRRFNTKPYYKYVLLDHNVPWVQDGSRTEFEHREWFTNRYEELFDTFGIDYVHVTETDFEERELRALEYFVG